MVASPAILPGVHGGPDALGVPAHDFSTNSNACGPCPAVLAALQQADATRYPDPAYTALRAALARAARRGTSIASWWRAARLNSSTASPPGPGCTAAPRCSCRPTATVTTPRRRRPMGWRCCDAVPRLRWVGRALTLPHPPPCTGPASPPARWARPTLCCLRGTPPRRPAVCGCWTAPTARCGLQHLTQTQSCPHPPGNCGRPTNPWA